MTVKKILSADVHSMQKLRALANGVLALENQQAIFEFTVVTPEEATAIRGCDRVLHEVERFVTSMSNGSSTLLKKAVFHSDVTPERIDSIIKELMRLRKTILAGAGVKNAIEEQTT